MIYRFLNKDALLIEKVIALGVRYSKTLGFMPEGGFQEHAKKGLIAIAIDNNELAGYLLFRLVKKNRKLTIVHLCVDKPYRKQNVSSGLIDFIRQRHENHVDGILLSCRRDFKSATKFWERYGFKIVNYQPSRSQTEKKLIRWYYHFGNEDLFRNRYSINTESTETTPVCLDTNIIIKYRDSITNDNPETIEVKSLFADWTSSEVNYYFTSETNNELNRNDSWADVLRSKEILSNFKLVDSDVNLARKIEQELKDIVRGESINDISDRRQLAECIAGNIEFFITLDNGILDKSDELYEKYKISVHRPAEFIIHIDQYINQAHYHPSRLAGAHYDERRIYSDELDSLIDLFINTKASERKIDFNARVYPLASDVKNSTIKAVQTPNKNYTAFWGYTLKDSSIEVSFLRAKGELSNTLLKQLVTNIIKLAVSHRKQLIRITDTSPSIELINQLQDFGFFKSKNSWEKICLSGISSVDSLSDTCSFVDDYPDIQTILNKYRTAEDKLERKELLYTLERALFPLKLKELDIPTYIVPIKAHWASQLFEYILADGTLYGSKAELSWNRENVYYRSPTPGNEKPLGRILWYVSNDDKFPERSKAITACSYLDDVIIDTAKSAYNKYKKYGVYEWKDIFKKADYNAYNKIKILKFSDTEVFKKPIKFNEAQTILTKAHTFVSPVEISTDAFHSIYKKGNQLES